MSRLIKNCNDQSFEKPKNLGLKEQSWQITMHTRQLKTIIIFYIYFINWSNFQMKRPVKDELTNINWTFI